MVAHLRSIEGNGQPLERVSISVEGTILIPDSWLAADDILDGLGAPPIPARASLDEAIGVAHDSIQTWAATGDQRISTIDGALQAVVFTKRMKRALARWKGAEAELRHIPHMRCPNCLQPHLWRRAPLFFKDSIDVVCGTPECGYFRDWFDWQAQYAPVFEQLEKDMKRREKESRRKKLE
ncbi:hypothetical protein [Microbacterium sp. YY-01]|uniref:hypothetical protein n=1 Tax=Microbacterium sp. YY-01 TaxID=3421634 RepID=UPI003D164E33